MRFESNCGDGPHGMGRCRGGRGGGRGRGAGCGAPEDFDGMDRSDVARAMRHGMRHAMRHAMGHGRGGFGPDEDGFAGGFGGGFGGGRGGRGGGRRRMFDGGELRLVLLRLVSEQPRHGYDLIRAVEALSGGVYAPSPGVVYPTLTLLEDMGLVAPVEQEGARKLFAITQEGSAELAEKQAEVDGLVARLSALAEREQRMRGGPVRRAMGNLRMALTQKLNAGEPDTETMHAIAEILDEAVQKIERL